MARRRPSEPALQRARATLRERWSGGRLEWSLAGVLDPAQRELLERYIAAHERADPQALVDLLREDIRLTIEPGVGEWTGKVAVARALRRDMSSPGPVANAADGREPPAGGRRLRLRPADTAFRRFALIVPRPKAGQLAAIDVFETPGLFAAFGLPPSLGY